MQIVSNGNNLHEMSNPVFLGKNKKNIINLPSAEFAHRVINVKVTVDILDLIFCHFYMGDNFSHFWITFLHLPSERCLF